MEDLISELISQGLGNVIDKRRDSLILTDHIYQQRLEHMTESENHYETLELTKEQRSVIDTYLELSCSLRDRISDLSYMAGIRDSIRLLFELNLVKAASRKDEEV